MAKRNLSVERGVGIGSTLILKHIAFGAAVNGFSTGYGGFSFARHRIAGETRTSWILEKPYPGDKDVKIPKATLAGTYTEDEVRALEAQYGRKYFPIHDAMPRR